MVEDCEKKRLWDRWLCRLGHALIDLGDNTYALKGQILAKDSVSGELVELEVVDGKLQIAPNVDVEVNLSENIGLLDSDENEINPATEDTLATGDITGADLTLDEYEFDPAVKAIQVVNDGVANITVTVGTDEFVLQPDEARRIQLDSGPIETVEFSADAVFRMNGIN